MTLNEIYEALIKENLRALKINRHWQIGKEEMLKDQEEFICIVRGKQNKLVPNETLTMENLKRIIVNNLRHSNEYNNALKKGLTKKQYQDTYIEEMLKIIIKFPVLADEIANQLGSKLRKRILEINFNDDLIKD